MRKRLKNKMRRQSNRPMDILLDMAFRIAKTHRLKVNAKSFNGWPEQ